MKVKDQNYHTVKFVVRRCIGYPDLYLSMRYNLGGLYTIVDNKKKKSGVKVY